MLKRSVLIENKARITTQYEQLLIESEEHSGKVPIEDIGFLVKEHQQTYISIPTLNNLSNNNISVIFCNEHHLPISMLLNLNSNHLQQEHFKNQISAYEPQKTIMAISREKKL